jgi:hypothetical protein
MSKDQSPYQIINGTVYFHDTRNQARMVCRAGEPFAVMWDRDGDILQNHGEASFVKERLTVTREGLTAGGFPQLAASLTLATFPATPETLEEVNACIAVSNRVGRLEERLAALAHSGAFRPN